MNPAILHIAPDEKFIPAARFLFERAFPGSSRFIIIKPPANPPLRFMEPWPELDIEVTDQHIIHRLLQKCEAADIVVLHGIDSLKATLVLESGHREKFFGIFFGAELYNERMSGRNYLGEKTQALSRKLEEPTFTGMTRMMYRMLRYRESDRVGEIPDMKSAFKAIPFLGDFSMASHMKWVDRGILSDRQKVIPFSYYPLEFIIPDRNLRANGPDILLGNSASATNNHLEAFELLSGLCLKGRKVVTPLSYGSKEYAKAVQKEGEKRLPGSFEAVTDYMPLNEYTAMMSRCGFVVMNHYRSQGIGNLIAALYMGAKVYVNDTEAFQYFRQIGCHIYLIGNELAAGNRNGFEPLSPDVAEQNRRIVERHFSTAVLAEQLRNGLVREFNLDGSKPESGGTGS